MLNGPTGISDSMLQLLHQHGVIASQNLAQAEGAAYLKIYIHVIRMKNARARMLYLAIS